MDLVPDPDERAAIKRMGKATEAEFEQALGLARSYGDFSRAAVLDAIDAVTAKPPRGVTDRTADSRNGDA